MNTKLITVITISMALSSCATMEESIGLGAGIGGAVGAGFGAAAGSNFKSAALGLAVGAVLGGAMGYVTYHSREEKNHQVKAPLSNKDISKVPSLTAPEVRRIWVPEKIDGSKFEEGHYEYVIERNSVWSR